MRFLTRLAVGIVAGGLSGSVAQAQSIYGPGGLFLNPTADFPAKGRLAPSFLIIPQESSVAGDRSLTSYSLDYGLTDRLEVGITHLKITPGNPPYEDGSTGGFLKYKLYEGEKGLRPTVAIGASAIGGGDVDTRTAFVALRLDANKRHSKHPVRLHFGLFYADKVSGFERSDFAPYAGVDVELVKNLSAFAEVRGKMEAEAFQPPPLTGRNGSDRELPSAVGVAWQPWGDLKLALAFANNGLSEEHKLSFGIGYTFGGR